MPQKFRNSKKKKNHTHKKTDRLVKKLFIVENPNTWTPSSFYDASTNLIWVQSYDLFTKLYTDTRDTRSMTNPNPNTNPNQNTKYAIHKDIYKAFSYMYTSKKREKHNKTKKYKKTKLTPSSISSTYK
jgi:hypothetical protein